MEASGYKSVQNALARGNILTKNGTIKNRGSKFPHMRNLMNALTRKGTGWRYSRSPKEQARVILEENPAWWMQSKALNSSGSFDVPFPQPWEIGVFVDKSDIITKKGTLKTTGSKFPFIRELVAAIKAKGYAWRHIRSARDQAIAVLLENPAWMKK